MQSLKNLLIVKILAMQFLQRKKILLPFCEGTFKEKL
jgi:hypothetical protein